MIRWSSRHPKNKNKNKGTQTNQNKKPRCKKCCRNFCKTCILKTTRFCYRRIKRGIKKNIFGTANPRLEYFEIGGYNLGSIKSKLVNEAKSKMSFLLSKVRRSSSQSLASLNGTSLTELKKTFSIKGSKQFILEKMVEDYNKGNLSYIDLPGKVDFDLSKLDKHQFESMLEDYETKLKIIKENENLNAYDLKKKFSLHGSKANILDDFVKDLKKGKLYAAELPLLSKFDPDKIEKEEMNEILEKYAENTKEMKKRVKENKYLNSDYLKRKFSVSGSKAIILDNMVADFKKGRLSAAGLTINNKFDPEKLSRHQLNNMLKKYEGVRKANRRVSSLSHKNYEYSRKIRNIKENIKNLKDTFSWGLA